MASLTTTASVDFRTSKDLTKISKALNTISQELSEAKQRDDTERLSSTVEKAVQALNALNRRTDGFNRLRDDTPVAKSYRALYNNLDYSLRSRVARISFVQAPAKRSPISTASFSVLSDASASSSRASSITLADYEEYRQDVGFPDENSFNSGINNGSDDDAELSRAIEESLESLSSSRANPFSHTASSSAAAMTSSSQSAISLSSSAPASSRAVAVRSQSQRTSRCNKLAAATLAAGSRLGWSNCIAAVATIAATAIGGWFFGATFAGVYLIGKISDKL